MLAVVLVCCAKPVRAGRDYYALLGVERDAPEGVIKRAYRKLTAKWHPDRHGTEQEKQRAQKKFIEITNGCSLLNTGPWILLSFTVFFFLDP